MPEIIEQELNTDFFKDFILETPADVVKKTENKIEQVKQQLEDRVETAVDISELEKELENQEDKDKESSTKEKKEEKEKVEDKEEKDSDIEYSFKPFIDTMIEHGVLDKLEDVEIGDSAEDLVEAFESTVSTRVINGIEEYKESIPELGKQFLDYLEKGGDPKKFIETHSEGLDLVTLDLESESNQKLVVREYLKTQGYTKEEIDETIQDYEDGVILEKQAKLASRKLEKIQEKQTQLLIQEQETEVKQREKELEEYVNSVQKVIKESKALAGLELTDKDRKEFEPYLFKRGKDGLTQYQRDLSENPVLTQAELAFLKFKKYDFAKAIKKGENEAAKKIRASVINKTEGTVKGATADTITKSDFSAFENMFKNIRK